jgi:hypothetical protein
LVFGAFQEDDDILGVEIAGEAKRLPCIFFRDEKTPSKDSTEERTYRHFGHFGPSVKHDLKSTYQCFF